MKTEKKSSTITQIQLTQAQANKNLIVNYDDLDMVKYYLTSAELSVHADIHTDNEKVLREAFRREDWKMIEFLLTSPKLKEKANLNYGKGAFLRGLLSHHASAENLEKIKFFFISPKLKEHFNLKADGNRLIEAMGEQGREDVLYFLMENNIYIPDTESTRSLIYAFIKKDNFQAVKTLWEHPQTTRFCHYRETDLFKQKFLNLSSDFTRHLIDYIFESDEEYLPKLQTFFQLSKNHYGQKFIKSLKLYEKLNQELKIEHSDEDTTPVIVQKI
jgi:hypothetical protein